MHLIPIPVFSSAPPMSISHPKDVFETSATGPLMINRYNLQQNVCETAGPTWELSLSHSRRVLSGVPKDSGAHSRADGVFCKGALGMLLSDCYRHGQMRCPSGRREPQHNKSPYRPSSATSLHILKQDESAKTETPAERGVYRWAGGPEALIARVVLPSWGSRGQS